MSLRAARLGILSPKTGEGFIAFVGATKGTNSLSWPSGIQDGDIAIQVNAADAATPALPSDFINIDSKSRGVSCRVSYHVYYASISPASPPIGTSGSDDAAILAVYRNQRLTTPVADSSTSAIGDRFLGSNSFPRPPNLYPSAPGAAIVWGALDDQVEFLSAPSGFTLAESHFGGVLEAGCSIAIAHRFITNTDPITRIEPFLGVNPDDWVAGSFCLRL